jgi:hypothetical protein
MLGTEVAGCHFVFSAKLMMVGDGTARSCALQPVNSMWAGSDPRAVASRRSERPPFYANVRKL